MGKYLDPNGMNFKISTQANIFVDKSGIIELTNSRIYRGDSRFIYVSRPRRFGKTSVLDMLCAYYSKSSECGGLFDTLNIAESETYQKYKGEYHVIYLDMQKILQKCDAVVKIWNVLQKFCNRPSTGTKVNSGSKIQSYHTILVEFGAILSIKIRLVLY